LVQRRVLTTLVDHGVSTDDAHARTIYRTLCSIARTNRAMHDLVTTVWPEFYERLVVKKAGNHEVRASLQPYEAATTAGQRLELLLGTGCALCGCPRVSKVHWPFPVRACRACFQDRTVSQAILYECHNVPASATEHLLSCCTDARQGPVYWKSHVQRVIGCRVTEYASRALAAFRASLCEELNASDVEMRGCSMTYSTMSEYHIRSNSLEPVRHLVVHQVRVSRALDVLRAKVGWRNVTELRRMSAGVDRAMQFAETTGDTSLIAHLDVDVIDREVATTRIRLWVGRHVEAKIDVPDTLRGEELAAFMDEMEQRIRHRVAVHRLIDSKTQEMYHLSRHVLTSNVNTTAALRSEIKRLLRFPVQSAEWYDQPLWVLQKRLRELGRVMYVRARVLLDMHLFRTKVREVAEAVVEGQAPSTRTQRGLEQLHDLLRRIQGGLPGAQLLQASADLPLLLGVGAMQQLTGAGGA